MKTYKQFITELNKFEKMILQKGVKGIDKVIRKNKDSFGRVKDEMLNKVKNLRSDPKNPFTSMRRSAENVSNRFRDMLTPSGIKPNDISNPTKIRQLSTRRANKQSWMGDQKSQLSKPPTHTDNPLDDAISVQFPRNIQGKVTTENIPKGVIPDQSKKLDAASKIIKFRKNK